VDRFSDRLKRLRKEAGFKSAKAFAEAIGMNYFSYRNYELSLGRRPKYEMLCKMADVLEVTTDELLGHRTGGAYTQKYFNLKENIRKLLKEEN